MSNMYGHMMMAFLTTFLLTFLFLEMDWALDLCLLNYAPISMSLSFLLDKSSSLFLVTVVWIFYSVFVYSHEYLSKEVFLKRFLMILSLFVLSMLVLILSTSLFSSLIGWDGLGVTSLFLILFYYSQASLKAGVLTFLMNRVGDCFFIMTLTNLLLSSEDYLFIGGGAIGLLLLLTSITKSAQIPFSTWLPAAMEAPTPVSALVHSSTLVTAGIYLLFRYHSMWMSSELKPLLMILSLSTCFMASLSAMVEWDIKKLIALSTLSQLGFIMFSFSLELFPQGFTHMLVHAFFKALLFMAAGLLIHSFNSSQSLRSISVWEGQSPFLMGVMAISIISMMGLPFMSGFYSKDLIVNTLKSSQWSFLLFFVLILSFLCTTLYSIRMCWFLLNSSSHWNSMSDEDVKMVKPMLGLTFLSTFGGSAVCWLQLDTELFVNTSKVVILVSILLTILFYWESKNIAMLDFLESKWELESFNKLASSLFFSVCEKNTTSSDLLGIPGLANLRLTSFLLSSSSKLDQVGLAYVGNAELLMFFLLMMVLMNLMW